MKPCLSKQVQTYQTPGPKVFDVVFIQQHAITKTFYPILYVQETTKTCGKYFIIPRVCSLVFKC